jgi:uncharacterized RDD family membrane protein YckC
MSNAEWYYAANGQQAGPVPWAQLQALASSGQLHPDDLVWSAGMATWQPASSIANLFPPPRPGYPPNVPVQPGYASAHGSTIGYYTPDFPHVFYAGFWIRVAAALLDGIILFIPTQIIDSSVRAAFGLDPTPFAPQPGPPAQEAIAGVINFVIGVVIGWLYYALQESSNHQATIGKRACGIKVIGLDGQRISFARATGRHFAEILSGLTLFVGYMMAGWTQRKQALHDMIAGTYVVWSR